MKSKLTLLFVSAALCGVSSAFTLGFSGIASGTIVGSITINVPGYGDVQFDAPVGSSLTVDSTYTPVQSLNFDSAEMVQITFLGVAPTDVDFGFVGVNPGELFVPIDGGSPNQYLVQLQGGAANPDNDGAGIFQMSFAAVPEPSSAFLGVIGASLLVIRRRR